MWDHSFNHTPWNPSEAKAAGLPFERLSGVPAHLPESVANSLGLGIEVEENEDYAVARNSVKSVTLLGGVVRGLEVKPCL